MPIVKVNSQSRMKKVSFIVRTMATFASILLSVFVAFGQSASPSPPKIPSADGKSDNTPLTSFEEEIRAKRAIKMAEKEHQENLNRASEIKQIGKELKESLQGKTSLDREGLKKVERLEKLTKKIRGEAGGEDEDITIDNPPADLTSAGVRIAETAESLSKEVCDTPRQVVSASVITNANVLLELIKLARTFGRLQQ